MGITNQLESIAGYNWKFKARNLATFALQDPSQSSSFLNIQKEKLHPKQIIIIWTSHNDIIEIISN